MSTVVTLERIDDGNRAEIARLEVHPEQVRFVGTVEGALQDAADYPEAMPWFRGIYRDGVPVGFVMLSWDVEPDPPHIIGPWFLWKLIVDRRFQHNGIGRAVVRKVANLVRDQGATELLTSYVEGEDGPQRFYEALGFIPTGDRDDNDEVIVSLQLG